MKILNMTFVLAIGLCLSSIAAGADEPTTADLMRAHPMELQADVRLRNRLAREHEKGIKLVARGGERTEKGEKQVEKAERAMKKGRSNVDRGSRDLADGNKLIQESERRFRENFPGLDITSEQ